MTYPNGHYVVSYKARYVCIHFVATRNGKKKKTPAERRIVCLLAVINGTWICISSFRSKSKIILTSIPL